MEYDIDIRVKVDVGETHNGCNSEEAVIKAMKVALPGTTLLLAKGGAVIDDIEVIGFPD